MAETKKRRPGRPPKDPVADLETAIRAAIAADVDPPTRRRLARLLSRGY